MAGGYVTAKALGFEWGGDWSSFKDYPHFQMSFGLTIGELLGGARPAPSAVEAANKLIHLQEQQAIKSITTAVVNVNGCKIAEGYIQEGVTYVWYVL